MTRRSVQSWNHKFMKNTSVPLLAARLNGRVLFVVSVLLLPASAARGQTTKIVGYIDAGGAPEYMSNLTTSDFSHVITGFLSPSSTNGSLGYDSMGTWTWNPQTQTSEYDPTRINAAYATAINAVRASGK